MTPRRRHRGKGRSPISSSLPRHSARESTETPKKKKKKKPRADCKLAQKNRIKIYMMHEQFKSHDACSNAMRLSSIEVQIHKIGLSIEFLTKKTPKFEKPLEQFVINW